MDGEQRVSAVVLFEKEVLKLGLFESIGQGGQGPVEIRADIFALAGELGQDLDLLFLFLQTGEGGDVALQPFPLLLEMLGFLLVLPGLGRRELSGQGGELGPLSIEVKENLARPRTSR
jgi:hypothetical protein